MNKYEGLEKAMCKELETIERRIASGAEMTLQDLEKVDKLAHALKSLATYNAMKDAEEYEMDGMSGRRGRAMNGRYVSRDGGKYEDGYSQGYSAAMSHMNQSGHWSPQMPAYYPYLERNW